MTLNLGQFLRTWVATHADLVALIGDRVSPYQSATREAYPRVTYYVVSENTVGSFGGPSGLTNPRVQLDVMARTQLESDTIAKLIKGTKQTRRLDGFSGQFVGMPRVQCVRFENRTDLYDEPVDGQSLGVFRAVLDFTIWHEEY